MCKYLIKFIVILGTIAIFPLIAKSQQKSPVDVTISNHGVNLKGSFFVAEGEGSLPTVILLQGFPGNGTDVLELGKQLIKFGINVLTFNYSGTSPSEGLLSFNNSLSDINSAYVFIHNPENVTKYKIDTTSIIVGGYSYGGGLAMTYAIKHPEIKHVISIAGNDWGEYFEEYAKNPALKAGIDANMDRLITSGIVKFEPGGLPTEILESGLDKVDSDLYLKRNAALLAHKYILLICGWNDDGVSIDRYILPLYRELQKENATNVKIVAFQDNHGFTNSRDDIAKVIIDWIKKHTTPIKSKTE
jgi:dienelactone hydrolase